MKGEPQMKKHQNILIFNKKTARKKYNKIAYQWDTYRPRVNRISQRALRRGCLLLGGVCSGWCGIPACTEADTPPCEQNS